VGGGRKVSNTVEGGKEFNAVIGVNEFNTVDGADESNAVDGEEESDAVDGSKEPNAVSPLGGSNGRNAISPVGANCLLATPTVWLVGRWFLVTLLSPWHFFQYLGHHSLHALSPTLLSSPILLPPSNSSLSLQYNHLSHLSFRTDLIVLLENSVSFNNITSSTPSIEKGKYKYRMITTTKKISEGVGIVKYIHFKNFFLSTIANC
jgi:hypothetical protein